jgi:hypothetical protein
MLSDEQSASGLYDDAVTWHANHTCKHCCARDSVVVTGNTLKTHGMAKDVIWPVASRWIRVWLLVCKQQDAAFAANATPTVHEMSPLSD